MKKTKNKLILILFILIAILAVIVTVLVYHVTSLGYNISVSIQDKKIEVSITTASFNK